MKKILTAMFVLGLASLSALPAHAQMFRQAMADDKYEQNIPGFRERGIMGPTGMDVNLDVVAVLAFEMARRDGSLAALPEEFRQADAYKTKFRTVNGLNDRTMPLEQFRALVNGRGLRHLTAADFEVAPPAPIVTAPAVAPAPVVQPVPAPVATASSGVDYRPQIRRLETQLTELRARPQVTLSADERQQLTSIPGVLEQLRTAQAAATASANKANASEIAAAGSAGNAAASQQAAAASAASAAESAELASSGSWLLWLALGLSVIGIGFGIWNFLTKGSKKAVKENQKELVVLKTRVEEIGDALPADIRLESGWQQVIDRLSEDEDVGLEIMVRGDNGSYEPKFTINIKKGIDGNVHCLAGIQGHNPDNAIAVKNLEQTVRKAGFKNRLSNPIGALRAAA